MSAVPRSDRWVEPAPNSRVIVRADLPISLDSQPRYRDQVWDLRELAGRAGVNAAVVDFANVTPEFLELSKRLVWSWINNETALELLNRKTAARQRMAAATIASLFNQDVIPWLRWLSDRRVTSLSEVDREVLAAYAEEVAGNGLSRERQARMLFSITRVWLHSPYLPVPDRLVMPPWEQTGITEVLGPSTWTAENKTPPIHPQTMSPLLVWAMRFVENFADDILRAKVERARIADRANEYRKSGDGEVLETYMTQRTAAGLALPGVALRNGDIGVAKEYLSGLLGIGENSLLPKHVQRWQISLGAPLDTEVRGQIDGQPWLQSIDYYEARHLPPLLATACLVVVSYLSGIRGQEVQQLRRGCCTSVGPAEGPARHAIDGYVFKSAIDADGNSIPGGQQRERPWFVIEPVARAIQVAEQLSDASLIFNSGIFSRAGEPVRDEPIATVRVRDRLAQFTEWVNDYCERTNRPHEIIPDDPEGPLHIGRFRRTVAWFIYRQPGGRIALGLQYGHIRSYTSEGYGARTSTGLRDVFPMEEAFAIADSLSDAVERLDAGERVSGPAASRYIDGVTEFSHTFGGRWFTARQITALRKNPKLRIYDNGLQPVACCHDATKALCDPDRDRPSSIQRTPDLTRCDPACGNAARTDAHIAAIEEEVQLLRRQADSPLTPEPIRLRLHQRIERFAGITEEHERSAIKASPKRPRP